METSKGYDKRKKQLEQSTNEQRVDSREHAIITNYIPKAIGF